MTTAGFGSAPKAAGWIASRTAKSRSVQPANGFPSKNISALYMDSEGVLWVGTLGNGLFRFQSGRCINYTTDNGLNGNSVDYIIEDGQGCLWIGSNAGLMRVKKSDLNAFAAGTLRFHPLPFLRRARWAAQRRMHPRFPARRLPRRRRHALVSHHRRPGSH